MSVHWRTDIVNFYKILFFEFLRRFFRERTFYVFEHITKFRPPLFFEFLRGFSKESTSYDFQLITKIPLHLFHIVLLLKPTTNVRFNQFQMCDVKVQFCTSEANLCHPKNKVNLIRVVYRQWSRELDTCNMSCVLLYIQVEEFSKI